MLIAGYLSSILMGVTLGIFGGGGSILTVPILVFLFGVTPVMATGYSLVVVGLTSLVGISAYQARRQVDWRVALAFAPPASLGVFLSRKWVIPALPEEMFRWRDLAVGRDHLLMALFAALMIWAAVGMLRQGEQKARATEWQGFRRAALIGGEGLIVGGLTGLVGAGGGFLVIPALVFLVGLPLPVAVGTSLAVIATKSLLGFLGDASRFATMDFGFVAWFTLAAAVGMLVGSRLAGRIPVTRLKPVFGIFLLLMALVVIWQTLRL